MVFIKIVKAYVTLARPKSWLKNIFVFVPLVFALELFSAGALIDTSIAFAAFCLTTSAVYAFNDICDMKRDMEHPVKRSRPIPAGLVSRGGAAALSALLALIGFALCFCVNTATGLFVAAYTALNLAYSLWLKHIPIIDCFCIAAGFTLRIYIGSAASGEPVSEWLFLTVVAMSLFMAFGKRRGELIKKDTSKIRKVLIKYNLVYLQGMIFSFAALTIMFYSLWAMNRGNNMVFTVPLVIFIVAKYLLLIHNQESRGDPIVVIFKDIPLLISVGVYGFLTVALLYFS